MSQIHRRFTDEQVRVLFQGYCKGQLARAHLQDLLGIGKSLSWPKMHIRSRTHVSDGIALSGHWI